MTFLVKQNLAHSYILSFNEQSMKNSWNSNLKIICMKSEKTQKIVRPAPLHLLLVYKRISFFSHEISILAVINATHLPENPSRYPDSHALPRTSYISAGAPNALRGATWVKLQQPLRAGMNLQSQLIENRNTPSPADMLLTQGSATSSLFSVLIFKADTSKDEQGK